MLTNVIDVEIMETKNTEEKAEDPEVLKTSKKKVSEESEEETAILEETISKAQDVGEQIGDIMEQKPVDPETALPPSTSAFLREGDEAEATHEAVPGGVEPELESKIVEKNKAPETEKKEPRAVVEPDDDLIEHQRDFERRPRSSPPKESRKKQADESRKPATKVEPRKPTSRPPPRPRTIIRKEPVSNVSLEGKFTPAVAGVADTNLKKCPNCGGFVNLAVSKTCFNCGYDIK